MTAVATLLAGIRALEQAATPGPWEHDPDGYMGCGSVYATHDDIWGCNIAAPDGDLYPRSGYSPKDDMAFIAAARTDVPRLIQALEEVDATPELGDRLHGSPDFIDGWNAALEEVRARITAAMEAGQ